MVNIYVQVSHVSQSMKAHAYIIMEDGREGNPYMMTDNYKYILHFIMLHVYIGWRDIHDDQQS